jgi:plasmid maintenance system antidote protein VapI
MYRPPSEDAVWPPNARTKPPGSKILERVAQSENAKQKELAETIGVTEERAKSSIGGDEEASSAAKSA